MKPEEMYRSIDKGEVAPLYFIYGEEEFLLERTSQRLLATLVAPEFRDFNYSLYYGKECRAHAVIDEALTLPMFAARRVVHIKRAEELPVEAMELMGGYLAAPSPETCIVLQGAKVDLRRKFFIELKKADLLVECKRLRDEQVPAFVSREVDALGKSIDAAAAELLVYYVGNNLRELVSQLEKLVAFVGERRAIRVDDIRQIVSDTKIDSVFELANALGSRDSSRSQRQLQTLLRDTDAPYMLVGALARHFRQLCLIAELLAKRTVKSEIGKQLKINPYFLDGLIGQARRFRREEFQEIMCQLHELDVAIKSGGRQQTLLEMLLVRVCTK